MPLYKVYRAYILGTKRKNGTARSLVHYKDYLQAYLTGKTEALKDRPICFGNIQGCDCKRVFNTTQTQLRCS